MGKIGSFGIYPIKFLRLDHLVHKRLEMVSFEKFWGVNGKLANFTPIVISGTYVSIFKLKQNVLLTCLIVTEEDLCKKHAKISAIFCPFSTLPKKCCPAAV